MKKAGFLAKPALAVASILFEIGDDFLDGAEFEGGMVVDHAGHESEMADEVDLAGDAFGVAKDMVLGIVGEKGRAFVAGDGELVLDVGQGRLQVERAKVVTGGDALGKRLVDGKV